jgi:hypothetical protein
MFGGHLPWAEFDAAGLCPTRIDESLGNTAGLLVARLGPAERSAMRSLSGGKQTFNNARRICAGASRRLAEVNRNSSMAPLQRPWLRL